ncbi:interferon-induced protein with tetratricopeptide repeats 5-like [Triplophysa rosa]|uniref:interferon-induced protein with tetratricopeptide repeats 5-like n=1 Tax=Triplophysa rosa TaxID=992332 RepID=UPI002545D6EE|nr:interferon-induced protein with tetratricopeptide repeats 5-like [Triplophysa rosa]
MSCTRDEPPETELAELQCHFTWDLKKEDTNITDHLTRLEQHRDLYLGQKSGTAHTHNSLAYVKYLLGSYEEALTNLQKSVELTKDCYGDNCDERLIVTYGNFAWLHFHMKQYSECKSYLDRLKEIREPKPPVSTSVLYPDVFGEKAWALFKFSRKYYDRAIECFRKALELEPERGEWNAGYAIVLYRIETKCTSPEDSSAIQQLRRAIETNPDNDELKLLLALKLAEFKLFDEAEDLVERALDKSPDSPHVIRYVGKYLRNYVQTLDRSIGLLKRALDVTPNSAFIHHQLALCYKKEKEQFREHAESQRFLNLSISHFEKAVTLKNGFIFAMAQLAALYGEHGQIDRADEMFQTALFSAKEKNEGLQKMYLYYGEFQQYRKRCQPLAIKYYKDCLKMAPDTPDGKKSVKNLTKIANKRLSYNTNDTRALGIQEFIEQITNGKQSIAEECEHVLESTCNEK